MGKGAAPSAPDPYATAAAQYGFGTQAAAYNTALQRPNLSTPYGSTTWSVAPGSPGALGGSGGQTGGANPQTGLPIISNDMGGPTGGAFTFGSNPLPPQYTETQTLSPELQALLEQRQGTTLTAGQGAQSALGNNPLPTTGQNQQFGSDARNAAYSYATSTLDPYWNEQQRQLDSSLRNSGASPGTPAYENAMNQFHTQRNQAYSQAENQAFGQGLAAQGQQIQQIGELRDIPLNEYTALSGGASAPAGAGVGGGAGAGSVSAPNIMEAFQNQYQGQLAGYNANVASTNADVGAISSILAAILAAG